MLKNTLFAALVIMVSVSQFSLANSKQAGGGGIKSNDCTKQTCKKLFDRARREKRRSFRSRCRAIHGYVIGNTCIRRNRGIR